MRIARVATALTVALLLLGPFAAATAYGQGSMAVGEISGTVRDADGLPLPGATATVEGENLIQSSVSDVASAAGVFRFRNLRPGTYTVTLSLDGFRTAQFEVRVNVGTVASVSAEMSVAGVEETIMVLAESPMIDVQNSQLADTFGEELMASLPIPREFIAVSDMTPGFSDRGAYGAGGNTEGRYRRGSATNAYRVNGVDVTEPDWGNTWVNPGIDSIAEVQVVGIGASAEFGNFTGATINVVTKGGTNQYHGSLSYYYQDGGLRGDNYGGVPEFFKGPFDYEHDVTATFGGPLVKEKILFFGSVGYRTKMQLPWDPDPLDEGTEGELTLEETKRQRYHGRLDWMLNDSNTIGFMYNSDPVTDRGLGQGPGTGADIGYSVDFSSAAWLASWQSKLSDDAYLDVRYSGYKGDNREEPIVCCDISPIYTYDTGIDYLTSGFIEDEQNGRDEIDASLTFYADDFLGASHDLKVGFEYEDTWTLFTGYYTGDGWIGIYPYYGYTYIYGYQYDAHFDAKVKRVAAYVQDNISVGDRLNLNLGLRFDNPKMYDEYTGPGGNPQQLTGYSYLDPRVGATLDLTGDARYVAHASWGRFHEKALTYGPVSGAGIGYDAATWYYTWTDVPFDPDNIDYDFWNSIAFLPENLSHSWSSEFEPYGIDPDLEGPRTDVLNVGFEAEVSTDWVFGVDYIHKNDKNMVISIDRAQHTWEPFEYTDPLGGTQTLYSRTDDNPDDFWFTNDDYYFRKHDMVIASLERRPSANFSFRTSLTWQNSRGNIENNVNVAWGWGAQESQATNPNYAGHPYTEGPLTYNREWQFKLLANYRFPAGIMGSLYWRSVSGRPWTPQVRQFRIQPSLNEPLIYNLRLEPRGNRTIAARHQLDVRLQKTFEISGTRLEIALDGFNITNSASPSGLNWNIYEKYQITGEDAFGKPWGVIAPRQFRLGLRFHY